MGQGEEVKKVERLQEGESHGDDIQEGGEREGSG